MRLIPREDFEKEETKFQWRLKFGVAPCSWNRVRGRQTTMEEGRGGWLHILRRQRTSDGGRPRHLHQERWTWMTNAWRCYHLVLFQLNMREISRQKLPWSARSMSGPPSYGPAPLPLPTLTSRVLHNSRTFPVPRQNSSAKLTQANSSQPSADRQEILWPMLSSL